MHHFMGVLALILFDEDGNARRGALIGLGLFILIVVGFIAADSYWRMCGSDGC
jgi:hypothetical protein